MKQVEFRIYGDIDKPAKKSNYTACIVLDIQGAGELIVLYESNDKSKRELAKRTNEMMERILLAAQEAVLDVELALWMAPVSAEEYNILTQDSVAAEKASNTAIEKMRSRDVSLAMIECRLNINSGKANKHYIEHFTGLIDDMKRLKELVARKHELESTNEAV